MQPSDRIHALLVRSSAGALLALSACLPAAAWSGVPVAGPATPTQRQAGKKPGTPLPQPPVPPIDVKASEGDSAMAMRGRPALGGRYADVNRKTDPWWFQHGGTIQFAADPEQPAVLLVHGLHQSSASFLRPSESGYNYDREHAPQPIELGQHSYAGIGVEQIGFSDELEVDTKNWFDFLAAQGLTVATFSYSSETFGNAVATTTEALKHLAEVTARRSPSAPPPIALVGHSMGGLAIRATLKSIGSLDRVHWVVTLCSPHQGSEMALAPQELVDEAGEVAAQVPLPPPLSDSLKQYARALARGLVDRFAPPLDQSSKELAPDSNTLKALAQGEAALPGVEYHTFGGTDPNYTRVYAFVFDAMSAVPQFRDLDVYFDWTAEPLELGTVSPLLARVRDFVPEVTPGKGDGLVADTRARLPWSVHESLPVNHVEVLWHRGLQARVASILLGPSRKLASVEEFLERVADVIDETKDAIEAGDVTLEQVEERSSEPEAAAVEAWSITPSAALKGRLGQLVVRFPDSEHGKGTSVQVYRAGTTDARAADGYGDREFELLPGSYDVLVNNSKVASVPVEARSQTRLALGLLHVQAGKGTYFEILDADGKQRLCDGYGEKWIGLPVGTVAVRIAGAQESVVIEDGKVTEF